VTSVHVGFVTLCLPDAVIEGHGLVYGDYQPQMYFGSGHVFSLCCDLLWTEWIVEVDRQTWDFWFGLIYSGEGKGSLQISENMDGNI
jgi:hypothetical protein